MRASAWVAGFAPACGFLEQAETAFGYLQSDGLRVRMLTDAEHRAESAYRKAREGYARGLNDLTTALQTETQWRATRIQLINAQSTLMQRSVQLFKALGGGWTPDRPVAGSAYEAKSAEGAAKVPLATQAAPAGKGGG